MGCGCDDPGSEFGDAGVGELVVVVKVTDVVDDPRRLVGEGIDGDGAFPACLTQLVAECDKFLVDRFLLGR